MNSDELTPLLADWLEAKEWESRSKDRRYEIEEKLKTLLELEDGKSFRTEHGDFKINVTGRIDKKVNAERAQRLAQESGLEDELFRLFRWEAAVNTVNWKSAPDHILEVFRDAIIEKPAKHSFKIEKLNEDK